MNEGKAEGEVEWKLPEGKAKGGRRGCILAGPGGRGYPGSPREEVDHRRSLRKLSGRILTAFVTWLTPW